MFDRCSLTNEVILNKRLKPNEIGARWTRLTLARRSSAKARLHLRCGHCTNPMKFDSHAELTAARCGEQRGAREWLDDRIMDFVRRTCTA